MNEVEKDIKLGRKIVSQVFGGNPYKQLSLIRQGLWAIAVVNGNIESTEEEQAKALIVLEQLEEFNKQVEAMVE